MTRDDGVDRTHRVNTFRHAEANPERWAVFFDCDWSVDLGFWSVAGFPTHAEAVAYADTRARGGDHKAGMEAAGRARA